MSLIRQKKSIIINQMITMRLMKGIKEIEHPRKRISNLQITENKKWRK